MTLYAYFKAFIGSFYSKPLYKQVATHWSGSGFRYSFTLSLETALCFYLILLFSVLAFKPHLEHHAMVEEQPQLQDFINSLSQLAKQFPSIEKRGNGLLFTPDSAAILLSDNQKWIAFDKKHASDAPISITSQTIHIHTPFYKSEISTSDLDRGHIEKFQQFIHVLAALSIQNHQLFGPDFFSSFLTINPQKTVREHEGTGKGFYFYQDEAILLLDEVYRFDYQSDTFVTWQQVSERLLSFFLPSLLLAVFLMALSLSIILFTPLIPILILFGFVGQGLLAYLGKKDFLSFKTLMRLAAVSLTPSFFLQFLLPGQGIIPNGLILFLFATGYFYFAIQSNLDPKEA